MKQVIFLVIDSIFFSLCAFAGKLSDYNANNSLAFLYKNLFLGLIRQLPMILQIV